MKVKTNRNELTNLNLPIVKCRYCTAQNLLKYSAPDAYNAGVYGWNYDVYRVKNVIIVTGRDMRVKGIQSKYADSFDKKAIDLIHQMEDVDFESKKTAIDNLLHDWINAELNG